MNYSNNSNRSSGNPENVLKAIEIIFSLMGLIGILTSIFNAIIFWNLRQKDQIYKFYLFSSLADSFYMLMISSYVLFSCGNSCENLNAKELYRHVYMIAIDDYLSSCLAIYTILIELFITSQRYSMFTANSVLQSQRPNIVMLLTCAFSLVYYTPVLFLKKIVYLGNNEYNTEYTKFGLSEAGRVIPIVLSTIRLFIASILLLVINIFTLVKFQKYLNKKKLFRFIDLTSKSQTREAKAKINKEHKTRKHVTQMVIFVAFTYSTGTIPYALYYGLSELFKSTNFLVDNVLSVIGRMGLRLMVIFKIVIFYNYNK
ncbi:hypothetical protein BpHYR1_025161, partial [Brachionus plicatilis]